MYVIMAVSQMESVLYALVSNLPTPMQTVFTLLAFCASRAQFCALCSWFWPLRNKMHPSWFYYERIPRWLDPDHQKSHPGARRILPQ
jgi:hypothetical protein